MKGLIEGKWTCFLSWLCYKRNSDRYRCATIGLWMHLGGLLSTQEAKVFLLNNLPRASLTRWLHSACLPLLNFFGLKVRRCLKQSRKSNFTFFVPFLCLDVVLRIKCRGRLVTFDKFNKLKYNRDEV